MMSQVTVPANSGGLLPQFRSTLLVAVGSNRSSAQGDVRETIAKAMSRLRAAGGVIRRQSPLYQTPAFPAASGPDYLNCAVVIEAPWTPEDALAKLHTIEADLGRRRAERWGAREIDLDLLAVGSEVLPDLNTARHWMNLPLSEQLETTPEQLILPHPRLHERAFVLVPLADIAPDWVHPITGQTVLQMRDALPDDDLRQVVKIQPNTE